MIDHSYLRKSPEGIAYFDYSDSLGVPGGVVIRNNHFDEREIHEFIKSKVSDFNGQNDAARLKIIGLNQKHTNNIVDSEKSTHSPADGVYSARADHILSVRTADCFPVFINDGRKVGLIHAGWRGVLTGILTEYFRKVRPETAALKALIGPGIRECCFEVSDEVMLLFDARYRKSEGNKNFIDVKSLILDELKSFGVKYIVDDGVCTSCNTDLFYSYRREGIKVNQMISFISAGG